MLGAAQRLAEAEQLDYRPLASQHAHLLSRIRPAGSAGGCLTLGRRASSHRGAAAGLHTPLRALSSFEHPGEQPIKGRAARLRRLPLPPPPAALSKLWHLLRMLKVAPARDPAPR